MPSTQSNHPLRLYPTSASSSGAKKILIVEDEAVTALDLRSELRELGYEIVGIADNAQDAVCVAADRKPHLVLMDIRLAGPIDGIVAASIIRANDDIPVVFLTAHSDDITLDRALSAAPFGYVLKPFQVRELKVTIELALYKHGKEAEMRRLVGELKIDLSKTLPVSGFLPICASCKDIRDQEGKWHPIVDYLREHSAVEFSHGLCPKCEPKYFPGTAAP